ncbi:P-loop NTPase fold protein [Streptomyces sp. LN245]|uniref:KAP family P-loop NTPase fold protein n=1 Tax=Streptomyces sp. LN245 TaxID=3112975 RepID=UPI00371DC946
MPNARFFNDEPFLDHEDGPDLLGYEQYAHHVVGLLDRVRKQTETGVLALIGPWGSGKSTVLGKVTRRLRSAGSEDGWLVAELNPWLYSDLESLKIALFSEIREALSKDERWSDARQKIGAFGQAISPLGKLTALFGLDTEALIQEASNRISGDTSASAAKHKAEEALRKAGHPVLVVMDDLDRLTPQELLVVFKLVRLVGHLPGVEMWSQRLPYEGELDGQLIADGEFGVPGRDASRLLQKADPALDFVPALVHFAVEAGGVRRNRGGVGVRPGSFLRDGVRDPASAQVGVNLREGVGPVGKHVPAGSHH